MMMIGWRTLLVQDLPVADNDLVRRISVKVCDIFTITCNVGLTVLDVSENRDT